MAVRFLFNFVFEFFILSRELSYSIILNILICVRCEVIFSRLLFQNFTKSKSENFEKNFKFPHCLLNCQKERERGIINYRYKKLHLLRSRGINKFTETGTKLIDLVAMKVNKGK